VINGRAASRQMQQVRTSTAGGRGGAATGGGKGDDGADGLCFFSPALDFLGAPDFAAD
jgi:hypothetical protein